MSRSRMPLEMWMAPGKWPRAHSLSSRTSTRIIFSRASSRRLISGTSACWMRDRASSTILKNPGECFMGSPEKSRIVASVAQVRPRCIRSLRLFASHRAAGRLEHASGHVAPVRTGFHVHDQGDTQSVNLLHGGADQRAQVAEFVGGHLEQQLVVDLKNHA